jgi:hypothetical protein
MGFIKLMKSIAIGSRVHHEGKLGDYARGGLDINKFTNGIEDLGDLVLKGAIYKVKNI